MNYSVIDGGVTKPVIVCIRLFCKQMIVQKTKVPVAELHPGI